MQEHFPDLVKSACVMQSGHAHFDAPGRPIARQSIGARDVVGARFAPPR
jgi:hypothetical protein